MATLVSVNVGLPKNVTWSGRTVYTGAWKQPVTGPRMVRRLNVDGDGQGDLAGHGGENRAVLVYQLDSIRYWSRELDRDDLQPGHFGENFTVEGLPDDEVCIGDRYRIGEAGHGEIFAERTVAQVVPAKVLLPVPVGLDLVDQHCPLLAAVPVRVTLAIAVDVEPADHGRAAHRVLPHSGVDGAAHPRDVLRQTDVHRYQGGHARTLRARPTINCHGHVKGGAVCGVTRWGRLPVAVHCQRITEIGMG